MRDDASNTDKSVLEYQLVTALLSEQRSARRWKNARFFIWIFLFLLFCFLFILPLFSSGSSEANDHHPYVALVRLNGIIMPSMPFSAEKTLPVLNEAFHDKSAKGVVLLINSPGGSPVQASIIHDKILQLKEKYHKQVIVVAEDALASGAYLVATAADKIFVNRDTVTGSIGVIMEGFGFTDLIKKIGVSRRVFTAGANKDRLDPFEPMNTADQDKIQNILKIVHQDFINDVLAGRKGKLNGDLTELFSGDFWTGSQAVKLGLVDGTANIWDAMQNTFSTTHYRDFTPRQNLLESLLQGVSTQLHLNGVAAHDLQLEEVVS